MSFYEVNAANTPRLVRFRVEGNTGATAANLFFFRKGPAAAYPHYGQLATTMTANQQLAQLRATLIVRAVTRYAPLVGLKVIADSASNAAGALEIQFETDEMGVFFNNAWPTNTAAAKNVTTDIADTVGVGGMTTPKTKPGLLNLLNTLSTISYDGGTTGPFGALSNGGAIVLPDGTTTSGAPELDGGVDGTHAAGLAITFLG